MVNIAYLLVLCTGQYKDNCKAWNQCPAAQKTWQNFKTAFTQAYQDYIAFQQAKQGAGIANHTESTAHHTADVLNAYHTETADAIHALATATAANQNAVANLTQANATLTEQVSELQTLFSTLDSKLTCILASMTGTPNLNTRQNTDTSYCWTHGCTHTKNHTSQNCRNKAEGHQSEATLHNRMGGSNKYCGDT